MRCITRLTFKADHDFLADNFKTCEAWFKKLKVILIVQNILKECNKIFKDYKSKKIIERVPKNEICKTPGEIY